MPRIPLFNNGQKVLSSAPSAPASVNPGGNSSLKVSLGGLSSAVAGMADAASQSAMKLEQAGQQPKQPYELADNSGAQAIADAVQQAGLVMGSIYAKEQQAKEIKAEMEAEKLMAQAQGDYWAERENDFDTDGYGEKWAQTVDGVRAKVLENSGLHGRAKERLNQKVGMWAIRGGVAAKTASQKRLFSETRKEMDNQIIVAIDSLDEEKANSLTKRKLELGVISPADAEGELYENSRRIKAGKVEQLNNRIAAAAMNDDAEMIGTLVKEAENFMQPDELEALRAKAELTGKAIQRDKTYNAVLADGARSPHATLKSLQSRDENGFNQYTNLNDEDREKLINNIGRIADRDIAGIRQRFSIQASNGELHETTLQTALNDGKITPEFREHLRAMNDESRPDASPDVANPMITKAIAYDPDDDTPAMANYFALQEQAVAAGLSRRQMQVFNGTLAKAQERNADAKGKSESAALTWGRNAIEETSKRLSETKGINVLDGHLKGALADASKLQKFGLDEKTATKIATLAKGELPPGSTAGDTGPAAAFREFKAAAIAALPASESKLTEWEYNLFSRAAKADTNATLKEDDPQAAIRNSFRAAVMYDALEAWNADFKEKNKRPPDNREVQTWVNDHLQRFNDAGAWDGLFKKKTAAAPMPKETTARYSTEADGSLAGIASSYGFEGDADNGFNSLGMKRGEQPWHGVYPTVALAPEVAAKLGVKMPRRKKGGEWDYSGSVFEIEANGKTTKAIYDEEGMTINPNSMNKLVDLTPEASAALGLPVNSNAKVKVRRISA